MSRILVAPTVRRRVLPIAVAAGVSLFAATGCGPSAPPPPPPAPPDPVTAAVFNRTNADRAARGLGTLSWDGQLYDLAHEWATHLAETKGFYHRDLDATINSPGFEGYAALGENILTGPSALTGDQMHAAWMASPSHYANIVGDHDSMAVAVVHRGDGNLRAVVNFGRHF